MQSKEGGSQRAAMSGEEVKAVLAQFRIPPLRTVHDFRRGSTRMAKALVECVGGVRYLLKRRGATADDRARLAYAHDVQRALMGFRFPVPALQTTSEGSSVFVGAGHLYELFEFVEGERFRRTAGETRESGLLLARFHKTLRGWTPHAVPPDPGGYHASRTLAASWSRVWPAVHHADPTAHESEVNRLVHAIRVRVDAAMVEASTVLEAEGRSGHKTVIHGDFHPGNLLFVAGSPIVMLDFDAVRPDQAIIDVANGCLQYGMHPVGEKPVSEWTPSLNLVSVEGFLRGYALSHALRLVGEECQIVPALMVEAAIAESVPRIALSGTFARRPGIEVLRFVDAKTRWIWEERARLATLCMTCIKG